MSTTLTPEQWEALRAPFEPATVSFVPVRTWVDKKTQQHKATVAAYVDARDVAERLDSVVGPENWSFDWAPVVISSAALLVAKGMLTIGGVTKCDVGDGGKTEPSKTAVSDSLKRAAVLHGIGRYLYHLARMYVTLEERGDDWVIPKSEEDRLRGTLPRPKSAKTTRTAAAASAKVERQQQPADDTSAPAESPASAAEPHESRAIQYPATETHERASSDAQAELSEALRKANYTSVSQVDAYLFTQLKRPVKAAKLKAGESGITMYEVGAVLRALEEAVPA